MKAKVLFLLLMLGLYLGLAGCQQKPEGQKAEPTAAQAGQEQPSKPAQNKPEPSVDPKVEALLDAAIQARGGLEKIKAASSWTSKSKGVFMGMPYSSTNAYRVSHVRMDITMPNGEIMPMVMGIDRCWMQTGPVVQPCMEEEKKGNKEEMISAKAQLLWPLKEAGWDLKAGITEREGKSFDTLTFKSTTEGTEGTMEFDPKTKMLMRATRQGIRNGEPGEFVTVLSDYKEFCGVQMPSKSSATFNAKPYVTEEITEMTCGPVDEKLFEQPAQVADGTVLEKEAEAMTVACNTVKGPYEGLSAGIEKLMGFVKQEKLEAMGAPMMVYLNAPPKAKDPKQYLTELCLPVAPPASQKPQKKGEFVVKKIGQTKVLSMYGIGSYSEKSGELAQRLTEEVKKRKLNIAGPMRQISYMDPTKHPANELVSEMQIPLKGGATKAQKGGK